MCTSPEVSEGRTPLSDKKKKQIKRLKKEIKYLRRELHKYGVGSIPSELHRVDVSDWMGKVRRTDTPLLTMIPDIGPRITWGISGPDNDEIRNV